MRVLRRVAERLLSWVVPPGASREGLLGDLTELAATKARSHGVARAALWYAREVAWALLRYVPVRAGAALGFGTEHDGSTTGGMQMTGLGRDIALAVRRMARTPGFTLAVAVTVGLGVGANTAVFSVVKGVLLSPLPFPEAERIVSVHEVTSEFAISAGWSSVPNFVDWRAEATSFEAMALFRGRSASVGTDERPQYVYSSFVTSDFLRVFGVEPALGRGFTESETGPEGAPVVVLGHGLWTRGFGADPEILGRTVHIDGEPTTVVGVMPAGFTAPGDFIGPGLAIDVWRPFPVDPSTASRDDRSYNVVARLAPDHTLDEARREMESLYAGLARLHPEALDTWAIRVRTWQDLVVGAARPALAILMGLVALVLVVTCANVANLMVGRALARETEMATMAALGAGRARALRELLVEALALSALGAVVGLLVGAGGVELFRRFEPGLLPRLDAVRVDGVVLAFGLLASLGTGLAFGGAAAATVAKKDPARSLTAARAGARPARRRLRSGLAAAQLATAFALLVAAGLLGRSFRALEAVDLGFDPEGVTAATVALSWNRVGERAARDAFVTDVLDALRATPGVDGAAMINSLPLSGSMQRLPVRVPGAAGAEDEEVVVSLRATSPGYPAVMGIPVLEGRDFGSADVAEPSAVLVNRTMAERFWPAGGAVGGTIVFGDDPPVTVVGVVGDVHHQGPERGTGPEVYRPYSVDFLTSKSFVVRSTLPAARLSRALEDAVQTVDPEQPVREVRTMEAWAEAATAASRFQTWLVAVAAALAVALAAVGLFATLAGIVQEGRREIALRVALGARGPDVLADLARRLGRPVGAGILGGIALALPLGAVLRGLLFGVAAVEPMVLVGVLVGCVLVSALAAAVPARRALALEPARTLREG